MAAAGEATKSKHINSKDAVKDVVNRLKTKGAIGAEVTNTEATEICRRAREQLITEDTMLDLTAPIVLVGDVHGQYEDLMGVFEMSGYPPQTRYLFLGDYVDRGKNSVETITLLLCYKLLYPDKIYLLRGNHETRLISRAYGFYKECEKRYSTQLWYLFQTAFDCLPLCARINERIFCMHGGLSPETVTWATLKKMRRPIEIPEFGVACDLLWADPEENVKGFADSPRGISHVFGENEVDSFCRKMNIDLIVRAHQVVQDGFEFFAQRRLVTIFSAPYYCGTFDNAAAMLVIDKDLKCEFRTRRPTEHAWTKKTPKRSSAKRRGKKKKKSRKKKGTDTSSSDTTSGEASVSKKVRGLYEDSIADSEGTTSTTTSERSTGT